jgi:NAD(P)-dependent dehydrogenase (short-subunit alcohol dehydrogenase family)
MTDLHGQVALVTGASRGIGQAIAIRLGQLGANVAVNYSRDAAGASQTVSSIEAAGSLAIGARADVPKPVGYPVSQNKDQTGHPERTRDSAPPVPLPPRRGWAQARVGPGPQGAGQEPDAASR